jgi:hypothetical protein
MLFFLIYLDPQHLPINTVYKKANYSFSIFVVFLIDKKGIPKNIKVIKPLPPIVNPLDIQSCLSKWKIKGFKADTKFSAIWTWEHGKGWKPLKIKAAGFKLILNIR